MPALIAQKGYNAIRTDTFNKPSVLLWYKLGIKSIPDKASPQNDFCFTGCGIQTVQTGFAMSAVKLLFSG